MSSPTASRNVCGTSERRGAGGVTEDKDFSREGFTLEGTRRRWTAEDLACFEERLQEAQAHLAEVSENVESAPDLLGDSRYRTLPEHLAAHEKMLAQAQGELDEASAAVDANRSSLDNDGPVAGEERARLEEALRAAQEREVEVADKVEKCQRFVDSGRENMPEDAEAEAHARVAFAEMHVTFAESAVDGARADLLPGPCREALELLAEHAADEWLERYGSRDERRRRVVQPTVALNIRSQLARAMFRPDLRALDEAINVTGDPEPAPAGRSSPSPTGKTKPPEDELADGLNDLRFGTGE